MMGLLIEFFNNPTKDGYLNMRHIIMGEFKNLEKEFEAECEKNIMEKSINRINFLADKMVRARDKINHMDQLAKDFGVYD